MIRSRFRRLLAVSVLSVCFAATGAYAFYAAVGSKYARYLLPAADAPALVTAATVAAAPTSAALAGSGFTALSGFVNTVGIAVSALVFAFLKSDSADPDPAPPAVVVQHDRSVAPPGIPDGWLYDPITTELTPPATQPAGPVAYPPVRPVGYGERVFTVVAANSTYVPAGTYTGHSVHELVEALNAAAIAAGNSYRFVVRPDIPGYIRINNLSGTYVTNVVSSASGPAFSLPAGATYYPSTNTDNPYYPLYTGTFASDGWRLDAIGYARSAGVASCPGGYSYNGSVCALTDAAVAIAAWPQLADGKCTILRGPDNVMRFFPYDPDCTVAHSAGVVAIEPPNANSPGGVWIGSPGDPSSGARYTPGDPAVGVPAAVETAEPTPSGDTEHVKRTLSEPTPTEPARVQQEAKQYYPGQGVESNPLPAPVSGVAPAPLPPALANTAISNWPTVYPGACGNAGQPACAVRVETDPADALELAFDPAAANQEGEAAAAGTSQADGVLGSIMALRFFEVDRPLYTCAQAWSTPTTVDIMGTQQGFDLATACEFIEPHEATFQQTALVLWYLGAVMLFIRLSI